MNIKPIETRYKGYRFRSRLEARWAVFFDSLGIKWEYEKEGYDLSDLGWYLPDFWLPEADDGKGEWIEIKGTIPSDAEQAKAGALARDTGHRVILLCGEPYPGKFTIGVFVPDGEGLPFGRLMVIDPTGPWSHGQDSLSMCVTFDLMAWAAIVDHRMGHHTTDFARAYNAARSARFEHGERPI
jgi:hypothetical protein